MDTNSNLTDTRRELAITYIADIFSEALCVRNRSLLESENLCIEQGHTILSEAMARALEAYDRKLCANLDAGIKVHDRRRRTLATKLGDVSFS